ncbi:hypothetical protein, partial [Streptomyces wedmorensis]|uniref:hypothetical protein n=1 Tax=Streptomyces wedmorensis TaxID=43759 RepID=UPI0037A0B7EE
MAVELAQHYAQEAPFSFRSAPRDTIGTSFSDPYQEQLSTFGSGPSFSDPYQEQLSTFGSGPSFSDPYQEQLSTFGYATGFPDETALVDQSHLQGPTGVDARLYVSQDDEFDDVALASGSGDEPGVSDQDQMEEEFEATTPTPGDEVMNVDEYEQSTVGGEGVVRTAMDAAFESAFGELLLGENADPWESGLGVAIGEQGGQGEDYLLFEDADSTDGDADEQAPGAEDAVDDAGSVGSGESWSSGVSAVSLARELTVAGLRELEGAADSEAERWYAGRTGQEVRRRRGELLGSWGADATAYPVLVDHLGLVVEGDAPPKERNLLLLLLSLTPRALAVSSGQLGRWLRPQQPPGEKQIVSGLGVLHGMFPEVSRTLGVRNRPPGEDTGEGSGERKASVADVLTRMRIPVWERGRLTARAVTVLGSWAVELGYRQAVSQARAKVEGIATVLFGHTGERAVAFVEQHLDLAGIPHDASPRYGARDLQGVEDEEPVTFMDRLRLAKITADAHAFHYGSVNVLSIAALLAGRQDPHPSDVHRALDMLEYAGYSELLRGTTLWDIPATAPDASLETRTHTQGTITVREESGELTDTGRTLLQTEAVTIATAQAARLGGVDLDALLPQIFATAHQHTGRRILRRWLTEAGLRTLTPQERPLAHALDALHTSRHRIEQYATQTRELLEAELGHLADLYFSEVESDPQLRLLRLKALQHATG